MLGGGEAGGCSVNPIGKIKRTKYYKDNYFVYIFQHLTNDSDYTTFHELILSPLAGVGISL
jgi:hypothetical protein